MQSFNFFVLNEDGLFIRFNDQPSLNLSAFIAKIRIELLEKFGYCIRDAIQAYDSLLLITDFPKTAPQELKNKIELHFQEKPPSANLDKTALPIFEIPCYYGPEVALDLLHLCDEKKICLSLIHI